MFIATCLNLELAPVGAACRTNVVCHLKYLHVAPNKAY